MYIQLLAFHYKCYMWNWKIGRALHKIVPFVTIIDKYVQNKTMFVTLQKSPLKLSLFCGCILKIGTMGWFSLFPPPPPTFGDVYCSKVNVTQAGFTCIIFNNLTIILLRYLPCIYMF